MKKLMVIMAAALFSCQFLTAQEGLSDPDRGRIVFADKSMYADPVVQEQLREAPFWQGFTAAHGSWWVQFNETTGLPHKATGTSVALAGSDPVTAAQQFVSTVMDMAGYQMPHLVNWRATAANGHILVNAEQEIDGLPVLWSRATFRLTGDLRLIMFGLDVYPEATKPDGPTLDRQSLEATATAGLDGSVVRLDWGRQALIQVPAMEQGHAMRLVQEVWVSTDVEGHPGRYYTLVDLHTGKVWYRVNKVHTCAPRQADVTITGNVVDNPLRAAVPYAFPDLMVTIGADTFYTDAAGTINLPNLTQPAVATVYMAGRHARVVNNQTGLTPSITDTLYPGNNRIDVTDRFLPSELAGYYNTDLIHDHMKSYTPAGFDYMDSAFTVNVELTSGNCNAFYNGISINFYAQGGGCPATALFNDVVFHEYGHGINYEFYDYNGGSFGNGAQQEGYADVWAISRTFDPVLGAGFQGAAGTYVRRYDMNRKVYPQDLVGQVHADGEIIAGAWYDTYLLLGNMDTMMRLFVAAQLNTPDQPDGFEGQLYADILLEALLSDDDDGNLFNGTPNDSAIIHGFALHGISLITNATLTHNDPIMLPAAQPVTLTARLVTSLPTYLGGVFLNYRTDRTAPYTKVAMTSSGGANYDYQFSALPEGTLLEYYFTAEDVFGIEALADPVGANAADPGLPYYLLIGFEQKLREDFDINFGGWLVDPFGDDDATTGAWEVNAPNASFDNSNIIVQTGTDHTPANNDNLCAFTGNAANGAQMGANDVDQGKTTIQSPEFDLSGYKEPAIGYWRWFINNPAGGANPGNDPWQVFISNDGQSWVKVERTFTSDRSWRQKVIRVEEYVQPTATVSLLFIAQDSLIQGANLNGGSIVEAAIDDLTLFDLPSTPTGLAELSLQPVIFPNPGSNMLQVSLPGQDVIRAIEVFDVSGRLSWQQTIADEQQYMLSTEQWAEGVYQIRIYGRTGVFTGQWVLQR